MVKEEKGEIRYTRTSPDDLELVKAAMNQGYKLIETSIDAKVVRIAGKDYPYEILKVLGFSSERKRMSVIIRDKNNIIKKATNNKIKIIPRPTISFPANSLSNPIAGINAFDSLVILIASECAESQTVGD